MSAVYPTAKEQLFDWAFNGAPVNLTWRMALVGPGFTYSAGDITLGQLEDVLEDDVLVPGVTYANGRVQAPDVALSALSVGDTVSAVILYFKFDGGTQLVAAITEATFEPLPLTLEGEQLLVRFADEGIFQL